MAARRTSKSTSSRRKTPAKKAAKKPGKKKGVWIKAHERKSLPPRGANGRFRRKRQTSLF